jgi:hypothetical protein
LVRFHPHYAFAIDVNHPSRDNMLIWGKVHNVETRVPLDKAAEQKRIWGLIWSACLATQEFLKPE